MGYAENVVNIAEIFRKVWLISSPLIYSASSFQSEVVFLIVKFWFSTIASGFVVQLIVAPNNIWEAQV